MSNSYQGGNLGSDTDYLSPLGSSYYNMNILQLIRNDNSATYKPTQNFKSTDVFRSGSSFTMNQVKNQFVKTGKLNSNVDLGFSFTVNALDEYGATITVTKS